MRRGDVEHKPKAKKNPQSFINVETKLRVADAIDLCIGKIGSRKVLEIIFSICFRNTLEKSCFPMSLLAIAEDEEMANVACALYYLKQNWEQVNSDGFKLLSDKIESTHKANS